MNIIENFPTDEKYHVPKSHLIMENGKPIFQGTLWACMRDIRNHESSMTRSVEHSPFTIMPAPKGVTGEFNEGEFVEVCLHTPSWQKEDK